MQISRGSSIPSISEAGHQVSGEIALWTVVIR